MQTKKIIALLIVILGLLPVPTMVMAVNGDVAAEEDADNALQEEIAAADAETTAAEADVDTAAVDLADADAFVTTVTTAHGDFISDPIFAAQQAALQDARVALHAAQNNRKSLETEADRLQKEYDILPIAFNPVGEQAKINNAKKAELDKVKAEIEVAKKKAGAYGRAITKEATALAPLRAREQALIKDITDAQAVQQQQQVARDQALARVDAAKARAQQAREAVANRQAQLRAARDRVTSQPTDLTRVKNMVNDGPTVQDAISTTTPRRSITARSVRSKAAQARSKAAQKNRAVTPKRKSVQRKSSVNQSTDVEVITTE